MEDPRIISALFIFLKMAYYNVLINTTLVPHWIAAIEVIAYIVRYICNNQLCWLNSIFFITYCKYLRINIRFGFDIALLSRQLVRTQPS